MAIITITGDNNANVLTGTSATDQYNINGLGGNDNMHGNALNDTLDGGTGDDHMGGGAGNDVSIVDSVMTSFTRRTQPWGIDRIDYRSLHAGR
jgi:Ca2+-binding RTX toxin-like protein